jgi:hypothetical protein
MFIHLYYLFILSYLKYFLISLCTNLILKHFYQIYVNESFNQLTIYFKKTTKK